eukprot:1460945-Ditylum_brightwellii.AAC.1
MQLPEGSEGSASAQPQEVCLKLEVHVCKRWSVESINWEEDVVGRSGISHVLVYGIEAEGYQDSTEKVKKE